MIDKYKQPRIQRLFMDRGAPALAQELRRGLALTRLRRAAAAVEARLLGAMRGEFRPEELRYA